MTDTTGFKVAFIGSHGVGKTSLCYGLAARLKRRDISLEVVHEVARRCPLTLNEQTSLAAQAWILHSQIADELVAQARYPVVICDRSILDNYVYLLLATGTQRCLEPLLDDWIGTYDLLVHVPIVDRPSPDGVRAEDPGFQRAIDERLDRELERRRLDSLRLDPGERARWLDGVEAVIWDRLRPPQLPLL